ncbi:MAG: hypothetical protein J0H42_32975 [Rhizobiales bacterium]|nr:hypothetical protein [Hyphomicrobiales bacterium]
MATLTVSFDIHYDTEANYDRIYKALNESIRKGLPNSKWWAETTSFYVVDVGENAGTFLGRIARESGARRTMDKIVVLDVNTKSAARWGNIRDTTIDVLVPFIQKL